MKRRSLVVLIAGFLLAACSKPSGDAGQTAATATPGTAAPTAAPAAEEPVLNVYNWSDYIAEDTLDKFTKETGIKVTYDVFDSNEILEAKLVAGNTGYDVVVPSLNFLSRQVKAGVFMPLDKSKLTNWGNLDPENLARIAVNDPGNAYAAPYLWGTTGIGYNVQKIQKIFGKDFKVDSWDLVFKPENLAKLKGCGVSFLDSPSEIIPPILNWLGEDPHSEDPAVIKKAEDVLLKIRPYITNFHSSNYIDYLANGDICIAVGWSGDIFIAKTRAEEAKKGVELAYSIPKEGAPMWFDMLAIPKDAKHPDNAHKFINFLMRPDIMAGITNYVTYANSNKASYPLVDAAVRDNPGVYPGEETRKKLFPLAVLSPDVDRLYTRIWTTVKTGK